MLAAAAAILLLIALSFIGYGLWYLLARKYMSYHAELTGVEWRDIPPRYQAVILGMLKMVGAGMLAFGAALAWLVLPLSQGERWAIWAILSLLIVHGFVSVYVTIILRNVNPSAQTNVASACAGVAASLVALVLAYLA